MPKPIANTRKKRARPGGFALPAALLAILAIGAVVTCAFYAVSREDRVGVGDLDSRALYVAEIGLDQVLDSWHTDRLTRIDRAVLLPEAEVVQDGRPLGRYEVGVRRLGHALYLVSSIGRVRVGSRTARRRVAIVVRTAEPALPVTAALVVAGALRVGDGAAVLGTDQGGPDCEPGDAVAAVTAHDPSRVDTGGRVRIAGRPPVRPEPGLDRARLSRFGDLGLQDLIHAATRVYAPGATEAGMGPVTTTDSVGRPVCDARERRNWGDPDGSGPCADVFPIIHAEGDLRLESGTGQGILIVEGDLEVGGDVDFYGVVIVRGTLRTDGPASRLEGSVIIHGEGRPDSGPTILANSLVQYSRCRVDDAFNALLRPMPLTARSWADLTRGSDPVVTGRS
jgi:hypothetical protein